MTFAELVIKFSTTGDGQTKTQIKAIEVELKNVSNASVNAANRVSQSFSKFSTSIKGVSFGNINSGMSQMSNAMTPAMSNLQSTITTLSVLNLALKNSSAGIFAKNFTTAIYSMQKSLLDFKRTREGNRVVNFFAKLPGGFETTEEEGTGRIGFRPNANATIAQRLAFEKMLKKQEQTEAAKLRLNKLLDTPAGQEQIKAYAEGLQGVISGFAGVSNAILQVAKAVTIALSAVYAFNAALIKSTVEAAFNFEELQGRLSALKGPAAANDILDFVRKLAEPSNFTTDELANSSVQLEAFGLNSKRILPTIAQLGMAFGGGAEKLRLLTDMFGRLSQGQLPDVQVMAQFGLSKSKLMKEGIKFDAQGSLLSSTREVFLAIEKIVNREYNKIFETMANTGNAKLASVTDVFERLKIQVGNSLMEVAKNSLNSLSGLLSAIERTGILEKVAQSMILPFQALANVFTGKDKSIGNIQMTMASWTGGLLAAFEEINIQVSIFVEQLARVSKLALIFQTGQGFTKIKEAGGLIADIAKGARGSFAPGRAIAKGSDYSMMILDQLQNPGKPTNINDLINKSKLTDFGKLEDLLKNDKSKEKQTRALEQIQQNTKTQSELTLRNMTYGGGELAAQGISAVQMGGFRSVSSPQINATNDIVRGVEKIVRGYSNSNNLNFSFRRS
jgi:hypothetical protein